MWFPTNDLPEIPATSNELYSRVLVIPFDVHVGFKREQKKQNFYEKLIEENPIILRRMALGGLLDYLKNGDNLWESSKVRAATDKYLDSLLQKYAGGQNVKQWGVGTMQDFVKAKKQLLKKGCRRMADVYDVYKRWCLSTPINLAPMDKTQFEKLFFTYFKEDPLKEVLSHSHKRYMLIK